MNKELLIESIGQIDDEFIHEYDSFKSNTRIKSYLKWASLVASILVIMGIGLFNILNLYSPTLPAVFKSASGIMVEDTIPQSIGLVFGSASTKSYITEYSQSLTNLMHSPLKDNTIIKSLPVYTTVTIDDYETYLEDITDSIIARGLSYGLEFEKIYKENSRTNDELLEPNELVTPVTPNIPWINDYKHKNIDLITDKFKLNISFSAYQRATEVAYSIYSKNVLQDNLNLFGEEISIKETESDKEIYEKLQASLDLVNLLYQKDFTFQYINRFKYADEELNNDYIHVYAYEEGANISDQMYNQFLDNVSFFFSTDDKGALSLTGIFYKTFLLENIGEYQLISLKDAKELLKMGYVFAGPQCLICRSRSEEVNFADYDGVEIAYMDTLSAKYNIPYYVFYKKIDNYKIAKTYVPAIVIDGMEDYFNKLTKEHHENDNK